MVHSETTPFVTCGLAMTWQFHRPLATFHNGAFTGHVDVAHPQQGVGDMKIDSSVLAGRLCCVERADEASSISSWPARLADAYVRGVDLVASYQSSDEWPFAPQIYWRAEAPDAMDDVLGSLSLLVSVSTHLLDTHPRIRASSELTADEVLQVDASSRGEARAISWDARGGCVLRAGRDAFCLLLRLPGGKLSYAEFAPASDFRQLRVTRDSDGRCCSQWELFSEFLEKGVIRRARLLAVFVPRSRDIELAAACCRDFSARPLPLTT